MKRHHALVLIVSLAVGCDNSAREAARAAAEQAHKAEEARQEEQARLEEQARKEAVEVQAAESVRSALRALGRNPAADKVVKVCSPGGAVLKRFSDVAETCAASYLRLARQALRTRDLSTARTHLANLKTLTGVTSPEIASVADQYEKLVAEEREREEKRKERERAAAAVTERKLYGQQLREHFLDQGLDIKVSVSGSNNDRIKLQFVLFDDVWLHNFRKGSLIDEIRSKGFKRVDLSDGYDWGHYFTFD